jgi:tetratricopeptide (TPR) repeat protein
MRSLWVTTGILTFATLVCADDGRMPIVNDAQRERLAEARSSMPTVNVIRHYEGLKHLIRGRLLEKQERLPEALQAYDHALQVDPGAVELMRLCLPLQFKLERTVPALRLIRETLTKEPKQPDLWLRYAQELLELQRHEEVIRLVPQAMQTADFSSLPAFLADLYVVQASALEALQRPGPAADCYHAALRIIEDRDRYLEDPYSPTAEELPIEQAKLLERLARASLKAGRHDAAMQAFRQADAVHPREAGRLDLNLAEVYLVAKQPDDALRHVRRCLVHKPQSDEPYRLLVQALGLAGKQQEIFATLEQLLTDSPGHSAIVVVLAEQYAASERLTDAEQMFREVMAKEPTPIKAVSQGLFRLLIEQGRGKDALVEFQAMCRQPRLASWARSATIILLTEPKLLDKMLTHVGEVDVVPTVRLLLLKMAMQARLWAPAEKLARLHIAKEAKPTESYLLLCQGLLEQRRYADLVAVCKEALKHEAVNQPLVFQLEAAKALAMTRQAIPALQALDEAKRLVEPNTTAEHKLRCTELYILHLLGRQVECIRQGETLLTTNLTQGPWARQVRYVLAHAYEAMSRYDDALVQLKHILREDANDAEAAVATGRCLLLQNRRLDEAERSVREAIEMDLVARLKQNRTNPIPTPAKPNPAYQATLGAILLRMGRTDEGVALLGQLHDCDMMLDPWTMMWLGDAYHLQHQTHEAEQCWKQASTWAGQWSQLGIDLRPSLQTRLKSVNQSVVPTGVVPASSSSPARP